jgi:hypothetical protein
MHYYPSKAQLILLRATRSNIHNLHIFQHSALTCSYDPQNNRHVSLNSVTWLVFVLGTQSCMCFRTLYTYISVSKSTYYLVLLLKCNLLSCSTSQMQLSNLLSCPYYHVLLSFYYLFLPYTVIIKFLSLMSSFLHSMLKFHIACEHNLDY